jgi:hypothetical protein
MERFDRDIEFLPLIINGAILRRRGLTKRETALKNALLRKKFWARKAAGNRYGERPVNMDESLRTDVSRNRGALASGRAAPARERGGRESTGPGKPSPGKVLQAVPQPPAQPN